MLDSKARKFVQPFIQTVANLFIRFNINANQVTTLALIFGILSAILGYFGNFIGAFIVLWISGLLDAVDGSVARVTGSSPFGTVLDITFDRLVEISIIICFALRVPELSFEFLLLTSSIIFSMCVFLVTGTMTEKINTSKLSKNKSAIKKSFHYQAGFMERTEAFIFFSLMFIFPASNHLKIITLLFFSLITFTAIQRMREAAKILS